MALWFTVEVDWDNNGTWQVVTNVQQVTVERGRFSGDERYLVGEATVVLADRGDTYHPRNTASPLYGKVLPGRKARIVAHDGVTDYPLFYGYLRQVLPLSGYDVKMTFHDRLGQLREVKVASGLIVGQKTGAVVNAYLDDAGVGAAERSVDVGRTVIDRAYASRTFGEAMADVAAAEFGRLYVDRNGMVVFEGRAVRFKKRTPDWTITDTTPILDISPPTGWEWVRNRVEVTAHPIEVKPTGVLWQTVSRIGVKPGETKEVWANYADPDTQEPCGGDGVTFTYDANTAEDGSGSDVSGDVSVSVSNLGDTAKVTLTNNGSVQAYVAVTISGTPIVQKRVRVRMEDTTSQGKYGRRDLEVEPSLLQDEPTARNMARFLLGQRKEPVDPVTVLVDARTDANALTAEISQRIRVQSQRHYLDQEYFIEGIRYVLEAGRSWRLLIYAEPAWTSSGYFVWGKARWGNDTRFAF